MKNKNVEQKKTTEEIFQEQMKKAKETYKKMVDISHEEAVKNRAMYGLDENGNRVEKTSNTAPATPVAPKEEKRKRGRPRKNKDGNNNVLKKEKTGKRGRAPALPILFLTDKTPDEKIKGFDDMINSLFGKYDGETLVYNNEKVSIKRVISKKSNKLHAIIKKEGKDKVLSSFEWNGKFYPARILNYLKS